MSDLIPDTVTPYKGLIPYAEEDAPFFFGRDHERGIITANLMAARLTVLYGPSGAGKSSVLRAGVEHTLREYAQRNIEEHGEPELAIVVFNTWRDDPVAGLSRAIDETLKQTLGQPDGLSPLSDNLVQNLETWTQRLNGELLIILDQFEEYFLYHAQEDGEHTFAVEFPRAVNQAGLRVNFLVALREDALSKIDRFKGRIPNLFENYLRITPLDREAAREAIEKPLDEYNRRQAAETDRITIEPALVDAVLSQVQTGRVTLSREGSGSLEASPESAADTIETSYLQLVMTRLWTEEISAGSHTLQLATLDRLQGAEHIVRTHLDSVMDGLTPDERDSAADVFRYLVTPSGTKIAYTTKDLVAYTNISGPQLTAVLERLAGSGLRILRTVEPPPDQPRETRYEIFHDVLASAILDWRTRYTQTKEKREIEQRLAAEAQVAAQLRQRRQRLLSVVAVIGLIVLIAMGALTVTALKGQNDARTAEAKADAQKTIASSRQFAAQANSLALRQYDLSALLSVEALNITDTAEARSALLSGFQDHPHLVRYLRNGETFTGVDASLCNLIAEVNPANPTVLKLTNTATGQVEILSGHGEWVNTWSFSPDCTSLTSTGDSGVSIEWNLPAELTRGASLTSIVSVSPTSGIDVSRWQGVIDWNAVKESGYSFAVARATVGNSYVDPLFAQNWAAIKTAGLIRGSYSVIKPEIDPKQQVALFVRTLELGPDDLPPVLDLELSGGLSSEDILKSIEAWLTEFERQTGRRPIIYSASWFLRPLGLQGRHDQYPTWIADYPWWFASYGVASPSLPANWPTDWTFWQYTDKGQVNGVISPTIDLNWFNGSLDDLRRFVQASSGNISNTNKVLTERYQQIGQALSISARAVSTLAFSPDGQTLASGSVDGAISLWNADTRQLIGLLPNDNTTLVRSVAFSPDGKILASAGNDKQITLWDVATRQPLGSTLSGFTDNVNSIAFSPDGRTLASGSCSEHNSQSGICTEGEIRFWDVATQQLLGEPIAAHTDAVFSVAFSPDSKLLASGGDDNEIRLWDVQTHQPIGTPLVGHTNSVISVAFSPDGKTLASGSQDKEVRLWDVATHAMIGQPLIGHTRAVYSVAFSPDGKILASGSWDKNIILWNIATHQPIGLPLTGHTDIVNSIAFSPGGDKLASGSWDNSIILWEVSPDAWEKRVCDMVRRNLTQAEWKRYLGDVPYRLTCPQWAAGK
jgi:WD40 repeat protein